MRRIGRLAAALVSTAFLAASVHAAKPPADVTRFDPHSVRPTPEPSTTAASTAICTLGESGQPVFVANYIVPPNDAYYVHLEAARCAPYMPPDTSVLAEAHVALNFPVACSVPVKVSVVAASGPTTCRKPEPSQVLCAEQSTTLIPIGAGTTLFDLPLPAGCEVEGDAFLRIEFPILPDECGEVANRPRLVTTDHCASCEVYNIYPSGNDDLCALQFPGEPIMYASVETCVVPALIRSWGSVKIVYR
jgi:hypothetical protein